MDIEARVQRIERRLAELEERIARLERLVAKRLAGGIRMGADVGIDEELTELRRLTGTDDEIPPPGKRH